MKHTLLVLLLAGLLPLSAVLGKDSPADPPSGVFFPPELIFLASDQISMSQDQREAFRDRVEKTQPRSEELRVKLERETAALAALTDEAAIIAQLDKVRACVDELKRLHVGFGMAITNLLTPEQKAKVHEIAKGVTKGSDAFHRLEEAAGKRIAEKTERVKAGVQKWVDSGRDPSAVAQALEKKFKPLMEGDKVMQAEVLLDRLLKQLETGNQVATPPATGQEDATKRLIAWDKERCLTTGPAPRHLAFNFARCLAAGEAGRLHAVWYEARDGKEHAIYKRSLDEGKTWEADVSLSNSSERIPKVAILPSVATAGPNVYAVWHERRAGKVNVYLRRSSDGGRNWDEAVKLSNGPANSMIASVAATGSDVHVVWVDGREGQENTYYRRSTDRGDTWGDEKRLPDRPVESRVSYVPCITASGVDVVLAWVDTRDGNEEDYVKVSHDRGATWGKDVRMSNHPGNSWAPSVAIFGKTVHLLWFDQMDSPVQPADAEKKLDEVMTLLGLPPLESGPAGTHMPNPEMAAKQRAGERMQLIQKESPAWIAKGGDAKRLQSILDEVHEMGAPAGLSKAEAKLDEALRLVGLAGEKVAAGEKDIHKRMEAKVKKAQAAARRWVQNGGDPKKLEALFKEFQGLLSSEGGASYMEKEEKLDEAIKLMGLKYTPGPLTDVPRVDHGDARAMRIRVRMRKIQAAAPAWVRKGGDQKKLDAMLEDFTQSMGLATKEWEIYYRRSTDLGDNWGPTVRLTKSPSLSHRPSVAVAGDNVHVTWWDDRDGNNEVYYKQSADAGVTWGDDVRLTNVAGDSHYPAIAVSPNYVHVIWLDSRDGSPQIYYLRKPSR